MHSLEASALPAVASSRSSEIAYTRRFPCLHEFQSSQCVMASLQDKFSRNLRKWGRHDAEASSSASALLPGVGVLNGVPEDATSDKYSVLKEPPPDTSPQLIEPQGEPPTGARKWKFNLDTPGATLTLPPVPGDWSIFELLPDEEIVITGLLETMFRRMARCIRRHACSCGWLREIAPSTSLASTSEEPMRRNA